MQYITMSLGCQNFEGENKACKVDIHVYSYAHFNDKVPGSGVGGGRGTGGGGEGEREFDRVLPTLCVPGRVGNPKKYLVTKGNVPHLPLSWALHLSLPQYR